MLTGSGLQVSGYGLQVSGSGFAGFEFLVFSFRGSGLTFGLEV